MVKEIPLSRGEFAIVDDEDFVMVSALPWHLSNGRGKYAMHTYREGGRQRNIGMHNLILGCAWVDHRNRNGLDNTRDNLRPATHAQNNRNRGMHRTNTSGYKGVCFAKNKQQWRAAIMAGGVRVHIGYFATAREAAEAYDKKALELHGEFALTNAMLRERTAV